MISLPLDAPEWAHEFARQVDVQMSDNALPHYSKTNLPPAKKTGRQIFIKEDLRPAYSDGTDWRWVSDETKVNP